MCIYTVISSYMDNYLFGSFTSAQRAREAIHKFICQSDTLVEYEDIGDYSYVARTAEGECYFFTILSDVLDAD